MRLRSSRRCGICLEECNNAVQGNGCSGHFFCEPCLKQWTATKNTCPICRAACTAMVTAHGYCRAQVQAPARPSTLSVLFYHNGPHNPPLQVRVHVSWGEHVDDMANILGVYPLSLASAMLMLPFAAPSQILRVLLG